jgi:DNA-binding MarR family transcriptional regulator
MALQRIDDVELDTASQLAELLSVASRRLRRGTADLLAPLGLTVSQARVLRTVAGAPSPLRMADLAARLGVVPRSATSVVDVLEEAGYLVRGSDLRDRRSVLVSTTASGRRLLQRIDEVRRDGAEELFAALGPRQRAELVRLLSVVCERGTCGSCRPSAPAPARDGAS